MYHIAVNKNNVVKPSSFYYQNGGLVWFYRSKFTMHDTWAEQRQVVLLDSVHKPVIEIAHVGFGGYLWTNETYQKLLNNLWARNEE